MTIYNTADYQIESIMNVFGTSDNVTDWARGVLYVQGLPLENYPYVVSVVFDSTDNVVQEDFDSIDRLTANVIPIFESTYMARALNIESTIVYTSANSAISPISMYQNAAT